MSETDFLRYVWSCGVLTIPILVWNVVFFRFLPPPLATNEFWRDILRFVSRGENSLRLAVLLLPFLMPLEVATVAQQRGVLLFVVGTVCYFLAWVALMIAPRSRWSTSPLGFLAPAYTPLLWLVGLGLLGRRLYWPSPYQWWWYLGLAGGFVALHVAHASIVYARNDHRREP